MEPTTFLKLGDSCIPELRLARKAYCRYSNKSLLEEKVVVGMHEFRVEKRVNGTDSNVGWYRPILLNEPGLDIAFRRVSEGQAEYDFALRNRFLKDARGHIPGFSRPGSGNLNPHADISCPA